MDYQNESFNKLIKMIYNDIDEVCIHCSYPVCSESDVCEDCAVRSLANLLYTVRV